MEKLSRFVLTFLGVVGVLLATQTVNAQDTCGTIGNNLDRQNASMITSNSLFVLNTLNPAGCSGTVTSYRYCYYSPPNAALQRSFAFTFYRRMNFSEDSYNQIANAVTVTNSGSSVSQLTCVEATLTEPVSVQAGDMLGACIIGVYNSTQLDIVGTDANVTSSPQYLLTAGDVCGDNVTVPTSVPANTLKQNSSLVLHLSANISQSSNSLAPGEIAAIVIVIVVLALSTVIIIVTFWMCKKSAKRRTSSEEKLFISQNPGFDNIGYCSYTEGATGTTHAQGGGNVNAMIDSGAYDEVAVQRASLLYTPSVETDESRPSSDEAGKATCIDSGSYAQVRTSPIQRVRSVRCARQEISEEEPTQRHTYELAYSKSLVCSLECSYENVNHYEPVQSRPVETKPVSITQLLEMNKEEDIYSQVNAYEQPASREEELLTQLKSWGIATLSQKELEVKANIGRGQFGTVKKGEWIEGNKRTSVALKSLKQGSSLTEKLKFLQEAAIMAQFRHPNVIMLYGVVVESQPMMLVVELAAQGDLRNYLISIQPEQGKRPPEDMGITLLQFSQHVALGMQYLSAKGFVHRDLAARNILVSKKGVCKVADFGMSRDLADEDYYVSQGKDKIPIKWTAPEAIHYKKYSTASDVWSYGCLLYEIWSVGRKPFETTTNLQAIRVLESGKRLSPPPGCPRVIYELMILCWHPETSLRPGFRDIVLTLVGSERVVLNIPEEDSSTNPLAGVLGAPLETGQKMYTALQNRYIE